jgi:hypothetical protein
MAPGALGSFISGTEGWDGREKHLKLDSEDVKDLRLP